MDSPRIPVLLDTDIGDDIDDAWALSVCMNHPGIKLVGVSTVWRDTELRAAQARYLLEQSGRDEVPVAAGARDALDQVLDLPRNCQADVLSAADEERLRPGRTDAVRMMAQIADATPGLVLLPVGPLTNVARFILEFPDAFAKVDRLMIMGGHIMEDREQAEYNVGCDPRASQVVFSCGKPITMVGLDVTFQCRMQPADLDAIHGKQTPLADAILTMTKLWQKRVSGADPAMPVVHDPLAALAVPEPGIITCRPMRMDIDEKGNCVVSAGEPNVEVATGVDPDVVRRRVVEFVG